MTTEDIHQIERLKHWPLLRETREECRHQGLLAAVIEKPDARPVPVTRFHRLIGGLTLLFFQGACVRTENYRTVSLPNPERIRRQSRSTVRYPGAAIWRAAVRLSLY